MKRLRCFVREFGFDALHRGRLFKAISQKRTCLMKEKHLSRLCRKIEIGAKLVPNI